MKNKFKIINIPKNTEKRDHRGTFTTHIPPLIRFKSPKSKNDLSNETKNFIQGKCALLKM